MALPVAFSLAYVREYGVNAVYRDQWEVADLFGRLAAGSLSLADLWAPHNEHRFFFPRIAMLTLGSLTDWNNVAEMYLIQACLLATLAVLLLAFRATVGKGPWLLVPVAFLVFSPRQSANMLWGYQITFAFAQTFGVLALYLLHASARPEARKLAFPAALAGATVAALSAVQGLLVWPAGLLQLLLVPVERRRKKLLVSIWTAAGLGVWVGYFFSHERAAGSSAFGAVPRPLATAAHYLTLLGNALLSREGLVLLAGAGLFGLVLVAVLLILRNGALGEHSFWLSLLAYALLASASITAGRAGLGLESALASRYTVFSLLAVVAVYAMLVKLWRGGAPRLAAVSLVGLCAALAVSAAVSYSHAPGMGAAERDERARAARVLSTYETRTEEELEVLHRHPESARRRAAILEELGYNVFADPRTGDPATGYPRQPKDNATSPGPSSS
jgi:hypothetical protein